MVKDVSEIAATSVQVMRRINMIAVLNHVLTIGEFGANDLIDATGLTRATVLSLCEDLAAMGWIEQLAGSPDQDAPRKGRPAKQYQLRARAGYVVGVDAGQHRIAGWVADLRGSVLGSAEQRLGADAEDPRLRVTAARRVLQDALERAGADSAQVFVTVVGVPAPVDANGESLPGDGYWRRMNPGFATALAGHGRILVENDANLAAVAEHAAGAAVRVASSATLMSGERFGAGLIVDGRVLRGAHGGAGELRLLDRVVGVGSANGFGALARDWAREARRAGRVPADSPLCAVSIEEMDVTDVFAAARAGDRTAARIVRRLGDRLARICYVFASLLDLECVVVAGGLASALGPVIARAEKVLREEAYEPLPAIVASTFGADVVLRGAIEHGLAAIAGDPLDLMR